MKKLFLWSFVNANTGKLESRFFYATPTVEGNKTRISREAFYGVRFLKWKKHETNMDQTARIKFGPYDANVQDQDGDRAVWQIYSADSPHNLAIATGERSHNGDDYDIKEHDPHYGTLIFCEHSPR